MHARIHAHFRSLLTASIYPGAWSSTTRRSSCNQLLLLHAMQYRTLNVHMILCDTALSWHVCQIASVESKEGAVGSQARWTAKYHIIVDLNTCALTLSKYNS